MNARSPRDTLIYDGECSFCVEQVGRIRAMDKESAVDYVPRQVPDLDERFPVLKEMNFDEGMRFVSGDGLVYVGADAFAELGKRIKPLAWFTALYKLPVIKQAARVVYRLIAANRKRLGRTCEGGACRVGQDGR